MKDSKGIRIWLAALTVTLGVSSVFGASIVSVGVLSENPDGSAPDGEKYTTPLSLVHAITNDGSQAVGSSVRYDGCRVPFRSVAPFGNANIIETAFKGGGHAGGIGITADGDCHASANIGSWWYTKGDIGRYSYNCGASWGAIKNHKGQTSEALVGSFNSVSPDGRWITGTPMKSWYKYGYVWDYDSVYEDFPKARRVKGVNTGKIALWNSAATSADGTDGMMVGQDKHGNRNTKDGATYCLSIASKAVVGIPPMAGEYTDRGQGRGISENGQYACGYMYSPNTGPSTYMGFRWSPGDANSTALVPYGSDHLSWGGDVGNDGTVGGWSYGVEGAGTSYDAAMWPGDTLQCVHLADLLNSLGADTSEWSVLTKVYSVSENALIVGGYGTWAADGTIRGFIADLRPAIILDLEILPNDDPNLFTVNKQSKGRIPMELYGSEELPGEDINLESIMIAGVASPVKAKLDDLNGDGILDVLLHFSRLDLIDALDLGALEAGTEVDVTVTATAAGDGDAANWPVEATDSIILLDRDD
jgi:hypothetical protein